MGTRRRVGRLLGWLGCVAAVASMWCAASQAGAQVPTAPGMRFGETTVTPAEAQSYFASVSDTRTYRPVPNWEIAATARALGNDQQKIFAFVRNNIRYEPRYGAQKGALGALIDRSGTAFDQSMLLVELLRAAGHQARYEIGVISLSQAQFEAWIGISNSGAALQYLQNGGIPASVGSGGSWITLGHAWVEVQTANGPKKLDPSYKASERWSQLDVVAASGLSLSSFIAAATQPTGGGLQSEQGVEYVTGVGVASVQSTLAERASSLLQTLKTQHSDKRAEEIGGGERIIQVEQPWDAATTGDLSAAVGSYSSSENLADKFRTSLKLRIGNCTTTFFVDQIYGRRLTYRQATALESGPPHTLTEYFNEAGLYLGHEKISGWSTSVFGCVGLTASVPMELELNLPYPGRASPGATLGTYMDRVTVKEYDARSPVHIVHGWGRTGAELQTRLGSDSYKDSKGDCGGPNAFTPAQEGEDYKPPQGSLCTGGGPLQKARLGASWLAQLTRATDLLEGASGVRVQHHYSIGLAYTQAHHTYWDRNNNQVIDSADMFQYWSDVDQATRLDIDSGFSTANVSGASGAELGARHTVAALGSMLEGSVFAQQQGSIDTVSTAQRMGWAQLESGIGTLRFHRFLPTSTMGPSVVEYINGVADGDIHCRGRDLAPQGYTVVQANDRFLGPGSDAAPPPTQWPYPQDKRLLQSGVSMHRGCAWIAFKPDGSEIAHVVSSLDRGLKGAGAPAGPEVRNIEAPKQGDLLKDEFKDRSNIQGVDLRTGAFTYKPEPDVSIGQGEFPYSLNFQRYFQMGGQSCPGCYSGWTHNFDIRATMSGGGLEGMGATSPLALAGPLVAIRGAFEIYRAAPNALQNQLAGAAAMRWLSETFSNNVVTVNQGLSAETFVRLADNSLAAAPSSQTTLEQIGQPTSSRVFGRSPRGAYWYFKDMAFKRRSGAGDELTLVWKESNPSIPSPDPFDVEFLDNKAQGFYATTWTFPSGVNLNFSYCPGDQSHLYGGGGTTPRYSYLLACIDRLTRVSNNLGIYIDIDRLNATTADGRGAQMLEGDLPTPEGPDGSVFFGEMKQYTTFIDVMGQSWSYDWEFAGLAERPSPYARLRRVRFGGAGANRWPVAVDDTLTMATGLIRTFDPTGNDKDADKDVLKVSNLATPQHGTATVGADGKTVTYTPEVSHIGLDSFEYTVSDGRGGTDIGLIRITRTAPANRPPTLYDDVFRVLGDGSTETFHPLLYERDPDGDQISITALTDPPHGVAQIINDGQRITYTPDPGYVGLDDFKYTVSDGIGGVSQANIEIRQPLPGVLRKTILVAKNTPHTFTPLATDSGVELVFVSATTPEHGVVTNLGGGSIRYTPNVDYSGPDKFQYTIRDKWQETATGWVIVTVAGLSNNPPITFDEQFQQYPGIRYYNARAEDHDNDPLTVTLKQGPSRGSIQEVGGGFLYTSTPGLRGPDFFVYTVSDGRGGFADGTIKITVLDPPPLNAPNAKATTVTGAPVEIWFTPTEALLTHNFRQPLNGSVTASGHGVLTYTSKANYVGDDSFEYDIFDNYGQSDTGTVTVTVNPPPEVPTAKPDLMSVGVALYGNPIIPYCQNLTINDTPSNLPIVAYTQPSIGQVSADGPTSNLCYTPARSTNTTSFTYTIRNAQGAESTATVNVSVEAYDPQPP